MMRRIQICLPLVLGAMLAGPLIAAAQQTQPTTTQKSETNAASQTSGQVSHASQRQRMSRRAARARRTRTATRKGAKRPEYAGNTAEVINGSETRRVTFENPKPANEETQGQLKVEVVNGTSTDTRYFYNSGEESAAVRNEPVVIGVQSSNTRMAGGDKNPVVTGITSVGSGESKNAGNSGTPVTKSVSPRPKRPAYQPDVH